MPPIPPPWPPPPPPPPCARALNGRANNPPVARAVKISASPLLGLLQTVLRKFVFIIPRCSVSSRLPVPRSLAELQALLISDTRPGPVSLTPRRGACERGAFRVRGRATIHRRGGKRDNATRRSHRAAAFGRSRDSPGSDASTGTGASASRGAAEPWANELGGAGPLTPRSAQRRSRAGDGSQGV